ncbi:MAG: invasion associated locus B family protein [Paracoccaceae bacterium]|jgi:hypothetical protein
MRKSLGMIICAVTMLGGSAYAQQVTKVAEHEKWGVYVNENPRYCYAASRPEETVNRRGGRVVSVTRGEILMYVTYRPDQEVKGQVTFTGGYPFDRNRSIKLDIDGAEHTMYPSGEWAWFEPGKDADMVAQLKKGGKATVVGTSTRGTETTDKFSLIGFTAAVEDAAKRCGQ